MGEHTITAVFDDGTADAKFTVAKAAASKSTSPKAGDVLPITLIAGLAALSAIVLVASRTLSRKQAPIDKHAR